MPKLKTKKAASKRFIVTKNKKLLRRYSTQNHFNSRDRGKNTRAKRRDVSVDKTQDKWVKQLMPYN